MDFLVSLICFIFGYERWVLMCMSGFLSVYNNGGFGEKFGCSYNTLS